MIEILKKQGHYYILQTLNTVKLTYVRTVPETGRITVPRDEENGKSACNLRRAKSAFLDLAQSNNWDYMGTFTSASDDPKNDIRAFGRWMKDWNYHHGSSIQYLALFELGEKGRRLHAHVLFSNVPVSFVREYSSSEYSRLPVDLKRLYSEFKTDTGTRLACCPWWRFGWSTLVPVDSSPKVASYMAKYLTKSSLEFTTKFGGHSYFASKGLKRPVKREIAPETAATVWRAIPENAWHTEYAPEGVPLTGCYIVDKDKVDASLWDYYSAIFSGSQ